MEQCISLAYIHTLGAFQVGKYIGFVETNLALSYCLSDFSFPSFSVISERAQPSWLQSVL